MRLHDKNKTLNENVRIKEYREGVLPYLEQLPFLRRLFHRLLYTRLHKFFRGVLLLAVYYGVIPYARDWKAVIFDREKRTFRVVPARLGLLGLG